MTVCKPAILKTQFEAETYILKDDLFIFKEWADQTKLISDKIVYRQTKRFRWREWD